MNRPRLLDLYCGAGGAARGYQLAGFDVTGIDNRPMPRYAGDRFIQADALTYAAEHGHEYDAIHASPPCQAYSVTRFAVAPKERPALLGKTREALEMVGKPWVIENVVGAPTRWHITLCGTMFGLKTYRHRRFELSTLIMQPHHPKHPERLTRNGRSPSAGGYSNPCGHTNISGEFEIWKRSMDIDWMDVKEITQAIPPAYTNYIGSHLMLALHVLS